MHAVPHVAVLHAVPHVVPVPVPKVLDSLTVLDSQYKLNGRNQMHAVPHVVPHVAQ